MYIPVGLLALVIAGLLIGFAILPDFLFFPISGIGVLIAGMATFRAHPAWGIGLMVVGVAMGGFGVKFALDHQRSKNEEADRAEDEVRRRMGRIREDE